MEFSKEEYQKMEKIAKQKLGWTFQEKCGLSLEEMISNPLLGKEVLKNARNQAGFIDKIKINKILSLLEDDNWKDKLKKNLT